MIYRRRTLDILHHVLGEVPMQEMHKLLKLRVEQLVGDDFSKSYRQNLDEVLARCLLLSNVPPVLRSSTQALGHALRTYTTRRNLLATMRNYPASCT